MNQCNTGFFDLWRRICRSFSLASQKYFSFPDFKFSRVKLTLFAVALTVTACSGGGGGGGGDSTASSSSNFVVSGTVSAPGGAVAFLPRKNLFEQFADVFISTAYAAISGIVPVPDGTTVELVRIGNDGTVVSVLATTTTSGGRYSFDLTALGLSTASDLIVQVTSPSSGAKMRAFVASNTVDLDPVSETAVRIVLQKMAGTPGAVLGNFTPTELADITGAINLLVISQQLQGGLDIEATVTSFMNAVNINTDVTAFVDSASASGQTSSGPGDVGNYFPLGVGNAWKMKGTISTNNSVPINYFTTIVISGSKIVNGVETLVLTDTNPQNEGIVSEDYFVKTLVGITDYGNNDSTDFLTPQVIPYRDYFFPLRVGASFVSLNKSSLDLGEDWGLDWINEKVDLNVKVTVSAFEDITVAAGSYANCVKITSILTFTVTFSDDASKITETVTVTEWFAPGVGFVKRVAISQIPDLEFSETVTEELQQFSFPVRFVEIGSRGGYSCGLTATGEAYCWGSNIFGYLGNGSYIDSNTPTQVAGGVKFSSLSVGSNHACGIAQNGAAYCWGSNPYGGLGDGTTTPSAIPVAVSGQLSFVSIAAGAHHTCGLTSGGTAYCWGVNHSGELGKGLLGNSAVPVLVSGGHTFTMLTAGTSHTCGITTGGTAYCWGGNGSGALGNGSLFDSLVPVAVSGDFNFNTLSAGLFFSCGVTADSQVYCWGANQGTLGNGTTTPSSIPVPVSGGLDFSSVDAGEHHACALTSLGAGYCWGSNYYGELGSGESAMIISTPVAVGGGLSYEMITAGAGNTCAVTTSGLGYCWGDNTYGQLGAGPTPFSTLPVVVWPP